jgi:hypothetical protein
MTNIEQTIKERLASIKPHSKWRFWGAEAGRDVAIVVCWFLTVAILGIVMYIIFHENPWTGLPKGFRYIWLGFGSLPWELIGLLVVTGTVAYFLSRKSHELYRLAPWLLGGVMIGTVVVGYLLAETSGLNRFMAKHPVLNNLYCQQGQFIAPGRGPAVVGLIESMQADELVVLDATPLPWRVLITPNTTIENPRALMPMRMVRVVGDKIQRREIEAYDIRVLDRDGDIDCQPVIKKCLNCGR